MHPRRALSAFAIVTTISVRPCHKLKLINSQDTDLNQWTWPSCEPQSDIFLLDLIAAFRVSTIRKYPASAFRPPNEGIHGIHSGPQQMPRADMNVMEAKHKRKKKASATNNIASTELSFSMNQRVCTLMRKGMIQDASSQSAIRLCHSHHYFCPAMSQT